MTLAVVSPSTGGRDHNLVARHGFSGKLTKMDERLIATRLPVICASAGCERSELVRQPPGPPVLARANHTDELIEQQNKLLGRDDARFDIEIAVRASPQFAIVA